VRVLTLAASPSAKDDAFRQHAISDTPASLDDSNAAAAGDDSYTLLLEVSVHHLPDESTAYAARFERGDDILVVAAGQLALTPPAEEEVTLRGTASGGGGDSSSNKGNKVARGVVRRAARARDGRGRRRGGHGRGRRRARGGRWWCWWRGGGGSGGGGPGGRVAARRRERGRHRALRVRAVRGQRVPVSARVPRLTAHVDEAPIVVGAMCRAPRSLSRWPTLSGPRESLQRSPFAAARR